MLCLIICLSTDAFFLFVGEYKVSLPHILGLSRQTTDKLNPLPQTILSLVSVLSSGKLAKRLADRAINQMDGVQNLRKAVYDYKVSAGRLLESFPSSR